MNQVNKRKIEKELVEGYLNAQNKDEKIEMFRRLTSFEKLEGELALKQQAVEQKDRELDIREDENETRKELENAKLTQQKEIEEAKLKFEKEKEEFERKKFEVEKELYAQEFEYEKKKNRKEMIISFIGDTLNVVAYCLGFTMNLKAKHDEFRFYEKQINKAYQFEETGTVTSFAGKKTLGDALKLPKTTK